VRTYACIDHGGFPLQVAINWSRSSQSTAAIYYIVGWQPSASIQTYSLLIACCFKFLLLCVLWTILNFAWVIFSVAAFAALWLTKCCLRCSCVSVGAGLIKLPIVLCDSEQLVPCCAVCGAMICWCRCERGDDNEKIWEVLRKMITKRTGNCWAISS